MIHYEPSYLRLGFNLLASYVAIQPKDPRPCFHHSGFIHEFQIPTCLNQVSFPWRQA